mmetsp:Transcript_10031/g.16429  ORF Transcript_10031/g.16429 Transcript_10031/m.16429 type:complete len:127 (-) Transcript_10031:714-1094(-)
MSSADELQKQGESLIKAHDAIAEEQERINSSIENLRAQLMENQSVEEELNLLDEDAEVFKALGPVLLKMDLDDAKATVKGRLERLNAEILRLDKVVKDKELEKQKIQPDIMRLQQEVQQKRAQEQQ